MSPRAELVLARKAVSEIRTLLRRTGRLLLNDKLTWTAENWVGVGLALRKDAAGRFLEEFVLTLWFASPLPFLQVDLETELRAFGLPELEIAIEITGWFSPLGVDRASPISIGVAFEKNGLGYQAGTLGAVVRRDAAPDSWLMLSNNHVLYLNGVVLANGNQPRVCIPSPLFDPDNIQQNAMGTVRAMPPQCEMQDPPSRNDGDFALADVDDKTRVAGVGRPSVRKPVAANGIAGVKVAKTGASTATTTGIVKAVDQEFTLRYPATEVTYDFENQIVIEGQGFSGGGDSGSLVSTAAGDPVALLFAGNGPLSVASPLSGFFTELGLSFVLAGDE
jgi:hypothetical protein